MSFSSNVKEELCRDPVSEKCCAVAECYGLLLYCNTFSGKSIKIMTESVSLAKRLPRLFRRAFGLTFDTVPPPAGQDKPGKLIFTVDDPEKIEKIFAVYGYDADGILAHHINLGVLEEDCCRQSFLRGAFFAGGSVTDPKKRYHLELVTGHYNVSREIFSVLLELGFSPKSTARGGRYITYFKQSEAIEDFLTTIGAPLSAMDVMSAKVMKDMRSSVNRRVNCDTANVTKTVDAAQEQLSAIRALRDGEGLDALPEKLRETALLRLENPELSLAQLAELANPPVTKSCLNHRLRKIILLARGK